MENMSSSPPPRPSPPVVPVRESTAKKPIPLPRFKNMIRRESSEKSTATSVQGTESVSPKQSVTKMLKDEFKLASDNVQERGKLVMQSTRRLAKNIISKRFATQSEYDARNNAVMDSCEVSGVRPQSLPSDDIFQSISFHSPLTPQLDTSEPESHQQLIIPFDEVDDNMSCESPVPEYPPPMYPPPPLPDETHYDEVSSFKSGHSGSTQDNYYCSSETDSFREIDGIYEELSNTRVQSVDGVNSSNDDTQSTSLSLFQCSDIGGTSLNDTKTKVLRSNSWTFYDSVSCPRHDIQGAGDCASNIYNEDPVAQATNSRKYGSSSSPSISSDLESLAINSFDEFSSINRSINSASSSTSGESTAIGSKCLNDDVEMRSASSRKNTPKSVILEFDPLYENVPTAECLAGSSLQKNDLLILAGLVPAQSVKTSNYGKVLIKKKNEESKGGPITIIEEEDSAQPPLPPQRFDSISNETTEIDNNNVYEERAVDVNENAFLPSTSKSLPQVEQESTSRPLSIIRNHWPSMKRAAIKLARRDSKVVEKDSSLEKETNVSRSRKLERPALEPHLAVHYSGQVYRANVAAGTGAVAVRDLVPRWCQLAENHLTCTADKSGGGSKDVIALENISSIYHHPWIEGQDLHCFEISISGKNRCQIFGVSGAMERSVWMQKILENFTNVFPHRIATSYTRFGWCFLKEGIGGPWTSAWLILHKRTLLYSISKGNLVDADLRKARSIVVQSLDSYKSVVLIDFTKSSLYLRMEKPQETMAWRNAIRSAAVNNGPELESQQLTQENIPVLVDKCLNFVYAHGSLSEGIYRRSGVNSTVAKLLAMFRQDAWAVQLSRQEFTEYDVANVLKRFFRDLSDPLLTAELQSLFTEAANIPSVTARLESYRSLLNKLPVVNNITTKRLLAHLYYIHEESADNRMPVDNLAPIWAPTLMHTENGEDVSWSQEGTKVIADLISLYPRLFEVSEEEILKEKKMRNVLQRLRAGHVHPQQAKPTGDLRIWVYIGSNNPGSKCINVVINPQKTCSEVCAELSSCMNLQPHQVTLQEVVLDGALKRLLHYSERVLDTVLRWSYWDEPDRTKNFLVLVPNNVLQDLQALTTPPVTVSGELSFADQKSKNFKTFPFEFSQAKLCCYKDKRGAVKLADWPIEEIVWYQGYEPDRNPKSRWALTFISKNNKPKRSKDSPYFGCALAGTSNEDQNKWMAALFAAEYPQGLLPPPVPLNLLE